MFLRVVLSRQLPRSALLLRLSSCSYLLAGAKVGGDAQNKRVSQTKMRSLNTRQKQTKQEVRKPQCRKCPKQSTSGKHGELPAHDARISCSSSAVMWIGRNRSVRNKDDEQMPAQLHVRNIADFASNFLVRGASVLHVSFCCFIFPLYTRLALIPHLGVSKPSQN